MRFAATIALSAVGLVCLTLLWGLSFRTPPVGAAERALARAVADHLETALLTQRRAVRDLAEQLGTWESLPEDAVVEALRSTARRHRELGMLVVADAGGKLLSGYDVGRPLGRERLSVGSLDPVLGRSKVLSGDGVERLIPDIEAGVLKGLELSTAIRRPDGSRPAYVGARLRMEPLRQVLSRLQGGGISLQVDTAEGYRVFPCEGRDLRGGGHWISRIFVVRAKDTASTQSPGLMVPALATLLFFVAMLMAWRAPGLRGHGAPGGFRESRASGGTEGEEEPAALVGTEAEESSNREP